MYNGLFRAGMVCKLCAGKHKGDLQIWHVDTMSG
jgi:hypothetical protein